MKKILVLLCLLIIVLPICAMLSNPVKASTTHYGWMPDALADPYYALKKQPSLATDNMGYLYLADNYYDSSYGKYGYRLLKSTDNGQHWGVIASWATSAYDTIIRNIAIDLYYDYIYLAYQENSSSMSSVGVTTYSDAGTLLNSVVIQVGNAGVYINPCVTCQYDFLNMNYVYFVYEQLPTMPFFHSHWLFWAISTDHGATFTTHTLEAGTASSSSPWITYAYDYVYIAYVKSATYGNGEGHVYLDYSLYLSLSWQTAANIDGESNPYCRSPVVAASHGGGDIHVLVAYEYDYYGDSSNIDVKSAYSTNFASWTGSIPIANTGYNETSPALSVDGQGSMSNSVYGYFHVAYYNGSSEIYGMTMYARAPCVAPGNWDKLAYGPSPIDDAYQDITMQPHHVYQDRGFAVTTQLRSGGNWYPIVAWPDSTYGAYLINIFTTTPEARANLASSQDNSATANLGNIIFDGSTYALSNYVCKEAGVGTYQASYTPASGYVFDHWAATPWGVSVSDNYANPTTVTLTNMGGPTPFGNLTAVYRKSCSVIFYVNPAVGSITFQGTTYTDGQTGQCFAGSYSATANMPSGYSLYAWGNGGGVNVLGGNSNPTMVQVTDNGSLTAELEAQVVFYTSPSNVGAIRWGADSPPDYTNGQAIWDYHLPPLYNNTVYVKATDVPGYTFSHWASSWSLTNATANPTYVNFTAGWIEAYYQKNTYLVVRGNDNGIYYRSCAGSTWTEWTKLPGATLMSPAATIFNNKLQIVVVGADGTSLWYGNVDLGNSSFSDWTLLTGATPSAPTLASNGTALCLVVRGMDNHMYCSWYTSSWGPWQVVPTGATGDTPAAGMLGNDLHIVVRGMDGQSLWDTIVRYDGSIARGWLQLSGATPSKPVLASYSSSKKLYLIVRGMDNRIWFQAYNGATDVWDGSWTGLPGATINGPAATVANDDLHIAVRGADGSTLWYGYESGLNTIYSWSGWTLLSGATPSPPTLAS